MIVQVVVPVGALSNQHTARDRLLLLLAVVSFVSMMISPSIRMRPASRIVMMLLARLMPSPRVPSATIPIVCRNWIGKGARA